MRALTVVLAFAASLAAAPAGASILVFNVDLAGSNEFPPNASPGTGSGTVTIDNVAHTATYDFAFQDLVGTTTMAHVHAPTAVPFTGNIGVATELPSFTGFPLGVHAGSYNHTFDLTQASSWNPAFVTANGGTPAGAEAAFIDAAVQGRAYLNIHTTEVQAGEIRSFLAYVPEPQAWALMILGFGMTGALMRARRRSEVKISA
jgi:hypothetical protein